MFEKSFHVRFRPAPAVLISTSTCVSDRLEISESTKLPVSGVYRRVSREMINSVIAQREKELSGSDKWDRLTEIIAVAEAAPVIPDRDLGNATTIDLSCY